MRPSQHALSAPYCSKIGCCVYSNNIKTVILCLYAHATKKTKKHILRTIVLNIENLIDSFLQATKIHKFDIFGHHCLFDKNIDRLTPYNISHSGKRKFPF
jgi:hypothetical protein